MRLHNGGVAGAVPGGIPSGDADRSGTGTRLRKLHNALALPEFSGLEASGPPRLPWPPKTPPASIPSRASRTGDSSSICRLSIVAARGSHRQRPRTTLTAMKSMSQGIILPGRDQVMGVRQRRRSGPHIMRFFSCLAACAAPVARPALSGKCLKLEAVNFIPRGGYRVQTGPGRRCRPHCRCRICDRPPASGPPGGYSGDTSCTSPWLLGTLHR